MVFGDGKNAGSAVVSHPSIRAISFTGSTVVGHNIQEETANLCKKLSLEVLQHNLIFAPVSFSRVLR